MSTDDLQQQTAVHEALMAPTAGDREVLGDPELLARAMGRLPDSARSRLDAFYVQELSHEEMAQRDGKTTAAVKISLHRARLLLRSIYLEEALALTASDVSSFLTLTKTIASHASMPNTPVGLIFGLLPPVVQASIASGNSGDSQGTAADAALLHALNDLVRSEQLSTSPCLAPHR